MDFEKYLLADRQIPFEDAAAFSIELRRRPVEHTPPVLTKEAKKGIMKLMLAKRAQGEDEQVQAAQDAVMVDPDVQRALDFHQAQAQSAALSQQVMAQQQQLEEMQQGMQMLQQQAEQAGQQAQMATQENQNLQSQLQGEMQMRQQANMQAMQAQDQAISTQAAAQQQRMQLTELADQMSLQLKQVASQDPVQAQQQQQQAQQEQAQVEQAQALAAMPPKQRKEMEQAQKAQQEAEVQGQQAQQAQMQTEVQQQAPAQGMVAQSSRGMSKVDYLRYKLKEAAINPRLLVGGVDALGGAALGGLGGAIAADEGERGKAALRGAALGSLVGGAGGAAHAAAISPARAKAVSELTSAGGRRAIRRAHSGKLISPRYERALRDFSAEANPIETVGELAGGTAGLVAGGLGVREGTKGKEKKSFELRNDGQSSVDDSIDYGKEKDAVIGKCSGCGCKVKKSEMAKHTCGMKLASVPGATTPLKARLIEAGLGAGLGATMGLTYEAARQRFSRGVGTPTPEEIDLARRNRVAQIKANNDPNLINRLAATKAQAQLDAEKDLRNNPKKALLRRALQGAMVGTAAAPSLMAAKRNLGPRIMGR